MAASQEQKVDYLLKKIGYVASKTGIAEDSTLSGTKKAPFGEAIPSPLVVPSTNIWADSSLIPTSPPASDTNYVKVYPSSSSGFRMTVDSTVSGNRSFIARSIWGDVNSNNVGDWIDTQFGPDYIIKVYKGDPASGGVQLSAAGSGTNDTWFFDYSSGVLNFNGSVVPSGITTDNIYIVGYRYIGAKGARPTAGYATFTSLDVTGISTFRGLIEANSGADIDYINGINLSYTGISTIARLFSEDIQTTGVVTASSGFVGDVTGNADTATALETPRTFQITGDVIASAISFDGTGNVSLAATIQPNSVALGTDTTGNYVAIISGTANEIEVTGSGTETASVTVGLSNNVVISNDLQVNNDTVIQGNLTVYGTETIVNTQSLNVFDKDIILGIGTQNGETDDTANGGGIAIASTEGSPLVCLQCGVNTLPGTYKQLLWLKNGTFAGLSTDAWISNYAVSIGSTIVDYGSYLSIGNIQFTKNDLKSIQNINSSGIVTANTFSGNLKNTLTLNTSGVGLSGSTTFNNSTSNTFTVTSNATSSNTGGTIVARDSSGNFSAGIITATFSGNITGDVTGNADTATALETPRTFEITGDVIGSAVAFDGTGNVSIAATIQPNSVALGTDTTGNYVAIISGTSGEVEVTGSGSESAAVTIGLPNIINISGVNASGIVTANTFDGSGSLLTNIPNVALDNSTVSFGGVTVALGSSNPTPDFNLINATGLPINTGVSGLATNISTFLSNPTSSNLASAITDETGTGSLVFSTNPTLVNPSLGIASATSINVTDNIQSNSLSVVGVITAGGFDGGPLSGSSGSFTQVNVSGIGTIETLDTTNGTIDYLGSNNINASGIVTAGTFSGNLRNTLTLNTSGTGLSGSTTFNNSGVSTFTVTSNATSTNTANTIVARNNSGGFVSGIVTATFVGNLTGNLNSSGINTATTLSGTTLTYTNGSVTNISGTNLNYTGISTISNVRSTTINNTGVGTITTLSGTLLSYTNASVGLGTITTLDFGTNAEHTSNSTVVATTSPTTIDSFAVATFRSARVQVQITQSTNYQTSDVLVIHDGSTASVVEYGSIATNDYLGTFSATVSGGNCLLQINMGSATSATVKVLSQRITV